MGRIVLTQGDVRMAGWRRRYVPIASTIAACLLTVLPLVVTSPILPDFAFLTLAASRLLRPDMRSATTAPPPGTLHELLAGQPLGPSTALWTIPFPPFTPPTRPTPSRHRPHD